MESKPRRTKKKPDQLHTFIVAGLSFAIIGIAGLYLYVPYREMWLVAKINQLVTKNAELRSEITRQAREVTPLEQEAAVTAYTEFGKIILGNNQKDFLKYLSLAYPTITPTKAGSTKDVAAAMTTLKEGYRLTTIGHDTLRTFQATWTKLDDRRVSVVVPYRTNFGVSHQTFYFIKTDGVWYFDFLN